MKDEQFIIPPPPRATESKDVQIDEITNQPIDRASDKREACVRAAIVSGVIPCEAHQGKMCHRCPLFEPHYHKHARRIIPGTKLLGGVSPIEEDVVVGPGIRSTTRTHARARATLDVVLHELYLLRGKHGGEHDRRRKQLKLLKKSLETRLAATFMAKK